MKLSDCADWDLDDFLLYFDLVDIGQRLLRDLGIEPDIPDRWVWQSESEPEA